MFSESDRKMMSIASIKGVQTRYRNIPEKEIHNARRDLLSDVSTTDKDECLKSMQKIKCLSKTYSEKLTVQIERLTNCLSETDTDFLETVLDQDCQLNFDVEHCLIEY